MTFITLALILILIFLVRKYLEENGLL